MPGPANKQGSFACRYSSAAFSKSLSFASKKAHGTCCPLGHGSSLTCARRQSQQARTADAWLAQHTQPLNRCHTCHSCMTHGHLPAWPSPSSLAKLTQMPNSPRSALKSPIKRSTGCQCGTGQAGTSGAPQASSRRTARSRSQRSGLTSLGVKWPGKPAGPRRRGRLLPGCARRGGCRLRAADPEGRPCRPRRRPPGHQSRARRPRLLQLPPARDAPRCG